MKDLDALVKFLKGKEAEINAKLQEWWNDDLEPPVVEEEWEDVHKKSTKKKQQQQQQQQQMQQRESSSRGGRGGGGRGGRGYRGGGRGAGSERRSRGDRRRSSPPQTRKSPQRQEEQPKTTEARNDAHDVPSPVANAPAPKGAWSHRGAAPETVQPSPAKPPVKPDMSEPTPVDVGVVAPQDPTPSGRMNGAPAPATPSKSGGNVWATKGSAHLIQKEKPKPPPPPPSPAQPIRLQPAPAPPKSPLKPSLEPKEIAPAAGSSALESGLPSTLSGGSWNASSAPSLDMTQSASSVAEAALGPMASEVAPVPEPPGSPAKPPPAAPAPANVLNMGQWEAGEGDDSQNLDFGFGSFGPETDAVAEEPASQAPPMPSQDANTATVSPARPPPGLSIGGGGMPPMPANAVLVHELEGKLESTTLGKPEEQAGAPKPMASSDLPAPPPPPPPAGQPAASSTPSAPPGVSQNYNAAYGGMGMYSYNNAQGAASGFMGQTPPAPGLGGPPQQKPGISGPPAPQQHAPQQQPPPAGLYGSAAPPAGTPADSTTAPSSTETSTTGIPPGIPNAMPYANPALFYGQQPYQMGQPHGGVAGYGYGYGAQFGGAAGFYGQQVMGQSGGYPSAYDDQPPQGRGGDHYQSKGNSRYRGSGASQYQNQFNPQQHGGYGYGGQPMGGYNVDHFNQARGGYGHGPPSDAHGYGMPQQQGGSNYEGKKGGRFQQGHQQLGGGGDQHGQSQNAPFLGGGADTSSNNQGGWSSNNNSTNGNNNQGGGGWGQPSAWQQGGN